MNGVLRTERVESSVLTTSYSSQKGRCHEHTYRVMETDKGNSALESREGAAMLAPIFCLVEPV